MHADMRVLAWGVSSGGTRLHSFLRFDWLETDQIVARNCHVIRHVGCCQSTPIAMLRFTWQISSALNTSMSTKTSCKLLYVNVNPEFDGFVGEILFDFHLEWNADSQHALKTESWASDGFQRWNQKVCLCWSAHASCTGSNNCFS